MLPRGRAWRAVGVSASTGDLDSELALAWKDICNPNYTYSTKKSIDEQKTYVYLSIFMASIAPKQRSRKASSEEFLTIREAEKFLTIPEVAEEIHSSTDFVRDEIARKHLACNRFGWRFLIARSDLAAYLQRTRIAALGEH